MTTVTLADLCEAIETTFTAAGVFNRVQALTNLTDGMNTDLTIQIYIEEIGGDAKTKTDRQTMGGGVMHAEPVVYVDVYARQRSHIGEDMKAVTEAADDVIDVLQNQKASPPFGCAGVKSFRWLGRRVIFEYGDPLVKYVGLRFTLTFSIF